MTTSKNGEPTSCPECGGDDFCTNIKTIDGGVASEYEVECVPCQVVIGYYAFGAWDPNFFRELST